MTMIDIGSFPCGTCQGVTSPARFCVRDSPLPSPWRLPGKRPWTAAEPPRAKSILLVWLGGGPSHLDLFDPKPKAPAEYRGPFATIATRTPGVRFTELLPKLADRSHKYSLIRSNVNFNGGHREAGSIALTGTTAATSVYPPNFGSIVARQRGHDSLPRFISLARGPIGDGVGPIQGSGGGTWGRGHDPFLIGCTEKGQLEIPSLKLASGLSPGRLEDRRYLLRRARPDPARWRIPAITRSGTTCGSEPSRCSRRLKEWRRSTCRASRPRRAKLTVRRRSARAACWAAAWSRPACRTSRSTGAGTSRCITRSPTTAGTRTPTTSACWPSGTARCSTGCFRRSSTTWKQRGLLETTLVVCMGEFGRTPRINEIGSRDHWHQCYFSLWAGAGVQPGRTIGESDARGEHPATDPITPAMVGTTMLEQSGISSATRAELRRARGGTRHP